VDFIFDLIQLVIQITLFGGSAYIVIHLLRSKKFNSTKTEVQNLHARISQLRLALKAKVKRKSNTFRSMSKAQIIEGDLFSSTLKSLCEVRFETSDDFQMYFEISKQLVKIISVDNKGEGLDNQSIENNYMCNDFKIEMDIIRIIKEMSDMSARVNQRIEEHNRTNSQKLQRVDSLVFPAITEVNRVFKSESVPEPPVTHSTNKAS
jgi:hypothetical protein